MKKLTGYIGAMIIVFALMGSILLGYALDINGTTEVINEYDGVTDVSGLYSYSDEKSYIDYNPASNYIGYNLDGNYYENTSGQVKLKSIENGTIDYNAGTNSWLVNGANMGNINNGTNFIFDYGYIYSEPAGLTLWNTDGSEKVNTSNTNNMTITISSGTIVINIANVGTYTFNNCSIALAYVTTNDDYDYYGRGSSISDVYLNNRDQVLMINYPVRGITEGNAWRGVGTNVGQTYDASAYYNGESQINTRVDKYTSINGTLGNGSGIFQIFYPKNVNDGVGPGIDYTESNRVNNYPTSQYSENRTTTTNQFNLSNMTGILTNYAPADEQRSGRTAIIGRTPDFTPSGNSLMTDICWSWPNSYKVYNFLLADIINSQSIPATTYQIKLTFDSGSYSTFNGYIGTDNINKNFDINTACLNYNGWYVDTVTNYNTPNNKIIEINDCYGEKEYAMYDPATGIIDIYNYNDVKIATRSAYNTYVTCFIYDNGALGSWDGLVYYRTYWSDYHKNQTVQTNPTIGSGGNTNLVTATYYQMSSTPATYMDVTKGIKINSSNISDTIWNNEYENGDVQIVFRSESIGNNYTNQIQTMAGDIITVDYTDSKYYVAINSEEAVEIGNWRNIVLDLNFNHDTVSVYPVKTFNSFIDVIVYNTPINIGKITHTDNTQLKWLPATNSLMFSVFKTSVFMDTYGVVMVDPSLNISNYFTDLNQFYRLKIYNFSVYGDDMTINGITGTVTGNNITFDETTILLNEMYVTYADGHVYIEDSYSSVDLGEITTTDVTMTGAWYFQTFLEKGYTSQKYSYDWDWSTFILDNTEFCIFYIGIALCGLIIARKFCSLSIIDYVIFLASIVLALSIQVIA